MKEQLINFETAKLAKEKGFDVHVENLYTYTYSGGPYLDVFHGHFIHHNNYSNKFSAPTQSLLQKWLREEHLIDILIRCCWMIDDEGKTYRDYDYKIMTPKDTTKFSKDYNSYEECLEKGLYEALKLI